MDSLSKRIEMLMKEDAATRPYSPIFPGSILKGMSVAYGLGVALRSRLYASGVFGTKTLPCKVISIGNITVGGTGKTPMSIDVTQRVQQMGYRVAVISRGYRGGAENTGGIVSDGRTAQMGPEDAGDEAFMMATTLQGAPVMVGRDRFQSGMLVVNEFNPDVIVLDDGFQHIKLNRNINLVLLDYQRPLGNGFLLPRGILREPPTALRRADALILTRCVPGTPDPSHALRRYCGNLPVFRSVHQPYVCRVVSGNRPVLQPFARISSGVESDRENLNRLKGRRAFCFSGIADNDNFRKTVEDLCCDISGFADFSDHHPFSDKDLAGIAEAAEKTGSDIILTTEKDYVRIQQTFSWPVDLVVLGICISFDDGGNAFDAFIQDRLAG
jgi:tetraacyldisaccharide 4'-kinase